MAQFTFDHWEVNGATYTSAPLNITVTADTTIIALYRETGTPPANETNYVPLIVVASVILIGATGVIYAATKKR